VRTRGALPDPGALLLNTLGVDAMILHGNNDVIQNGDHYDGNLYGGKQNKINPTHTVRRSRGRISHITFGTRPGI
jgi:hypothetical protein